MSFLASAFTSLFAAAGTTAAAGATTATAAAPAFISGAGDAAAAFVPAATTATSALAGASTTGSTLFSILQGTATALSVLSTVGAANLKADQLDEEAAETKSQASLTTLQGVDQRRSIKAALAQAIGDQDVAYAASGADLSFGTPLAAREAAFANEDLAVNSQASTQMSTLAQLARRRAAYLAQASLTRGYGLIQGLGTAAQGGAAIALRG